MKENNIEDMLVAVELEFENALYGIEDSELWNCGAIIKEDMPYDKSGRLEHKTSSGESSV